MKCTYEIQVRAQCPVNPLDTDLYQFEIESESLIQVEKIIEFFKENAGSKNVFQEALTQNCAVYLGAMVKSVGYHTGIKVTCHSP
jgi:hypothetical protein